MITMYRSTPNGVIAIQEPVEGCWIHMTSPDAEEIARIETAYAIPREFLTYPLDVDETARTEKEEGVALVILRVPRHEGPGSDIPFTTVPLGIILTERAVVTVSAQESEVLRGMSNGKLRGISTAKRNRFLLHLFLLTAQQYLVDLRAINKAVDVLEDNLQASLRNREVLDLLKYQKSLTYFTTALKANQLMMDRLQKGQMFKMFPDDEDLLEDALTEIGQAIEMTNISSGILSQMMDAFASIISNNLNAVMKFLASVTIILALPSLVASIYGMNVALPLGEHPFAFLMVLGFSFVVALLVVLIFWRRDWL
ncbi:MAG: magnesium transporter CorA family protein [Anaerolineales bacterium]|nr:magnesium transporter CorA family protein [Anaerolineales bacterium]